MGQQVFVKVVGFTDVERHALNTVFRLSAEGGTAYALWTPDAPAAPQLALIDGQSYEARLELESPAVADLKLIWVGSIAPAHAWLTFERPLQWPDIVQAMDAIFEERPPLDLDLDFDFDGDHPPAPQAPGKRALIVDPGQEDRFYLRAKLASVGLLQADEAASGAEALELLKIHAYNVALLNLDVTDMEGWQLFRQVGAVKPNTPQVILTTSNRSLALKTRAWFAGAAGCLDKPLHPGKLAELLQKV
ncbi:MAG: response regulator [Burkholderiaceae bacterium]